MSDEEMKAINKQIDDMVRAGMTEGIGKENYNIVQDIHSVRGKPGKNVPGGLKLNSGGVKGGKVINETKIVDIPTPDTSSFVSRRMTLAGPGAALKKAIGVFPFVGSAFKKGKKG